MERRPWHPDCGTVPAVNRPLRIVAAAVFAAVLIVGAVWAAGLYRNHTTYGTIVTEKNLSVTIDQGDRLTLSVPDRGPSVGDNWSHSAEPANGLKFIEKRHISDSLVERLFGSAPGGGAGDTYFIFEAEQSRRVSVTLTNCFQGCGSARTKEQSRSVSWQVTVR